MSKYVFVGSEAEGYYSNSYECKGVFLTEEYYDIHKSEIEGAFSNRTFYELDGKHSEVDGDLIVKKFDNVPEIVKFIADNDVSYDAYHLTEYLDDGVHDDHVDKTYKEIESLIGDYKTYTYSLTPEQNEKVAAFIEELTKGSR